VLQQPSGLLWAVITYVDPQCKLQDEDENEKYFSQMERRASTVLYDFDGPEHVQDQERRVSSRSEPMLGAYHDSHRSSLPTMAESGVDSIGSAHGSSMVDVAENDTSPGTSTVSGSTSTTIGLGLPPSRGTNGGCCWTFMPPCV
jgi:hypothetical protein